MNKANEMLEKKEFVQQPLRDIPKMTPEYEEEYSAFSEFIGKFGRSYATFDEHNGKFETFRVNYRDVKEHNLRFDAGEVTWTKAINQFADMSKEEFSKRYLSAELNKPEVLNKPETKPHMVKAGHLPETVDWYAAGKVSESVDQGGCGACWAFTTATTLESLNAI